MAEYPEARSRLGPRGQVFLTAIILSGLAVVAASVYQLHVQPIEYRWLMLAALTLVSGSATVRLPSIPASISVSETFVFASVLLFGSAAGTLTVALDGLVISFWMAKRRPEWYRALFNMSAPAVSIWCASQLLFALPNIQPLSLQPISINSLLAPLVLFAIVYFGLNSSLIALAVAFETGSHPYTIWRENFLWLSLNYFCGASVALLLVVYTRDVDLRFIGVIVPLLLVLYFTYKTTMERVEDANIHLLQLNRLHLSTIETLAMAIDAKDQITHGHIRRVQSLAVGLARRVGVSDEKLIKAIEAAALLHDMGKLAVPEYILNKPGTLTAAEFEKMKLHATVGADILAAIEFPYPVVPIVRHHHESWDGSGYPDGLKGPNIPIGARILSVVDCFDALTSDRPYRTRLTNDEALQILIERRGQMYDPLIVDTFVRVHTELAPSAPSSHTAPLALLEITSSTQFPAAAVGVGVSDDGTAGNANVTLCELARAIAGHSLLETGDIIARHVQGLIPSAACVFYSYDAVTDELTVAFAAGDSAGSHLGGLRINLGQRLSGWVAANRQTVLNSDPALDLGDIAKAFTPKLRSCLSTPLIVEDELIGVLALYSNTSTGFSESERDLLEGSARPIARGFRRARSKPGSADQLANLPALAHLEQLVAPRGENVLPVHLATLLFVDVIGDDDAIGFHSASTSEHALRRVVYEMHSLLTPGDILLRHGANGVVALLTDQDQSGANEMAERLRDNVNRGRHERGFPNNELFDVTYAIVSAPTDGLSLPELTMTAKMRLVGRKVHARTQ